MGAHERRRQKKIKQYVIDRDGSVCCYCDKILLPEEITMEHIVPDSYRGTFNTTNLTVSCSAHNNQRGNKPFFEYCQQFNWSPDKMDKYKKLYFNNLKIKVLNIAKEECLPSLTNEDSQAMPLAVIQKACRILKIKSMDFSEYEKTFQFEISFTDTVDKKKIKFCFEQLIRLIEAESA